MAIETEIPGFACGACGSHIVAIEAPLTHTSGVRCCGCGGSKGRWDAFDRHLEAFRTLSRTRHSDFASGSGFEAAGRQVVGGALTAGGAMLAR